VVTVSPSDSEDDDQDFLNKGNAPTHMPRNSDGDHDMEDAPDPDVTAAGWGKAAGPIEPPVKLPIKKKGGSIRARLQRQ
jgi:hypothetical protein